MTVLDDDGAGAGGPGGSGGAGGALTVRVWPLCAAWGGDTGLCAPIGMAGGAGTLFWGVIGEVGWGDINAADILRSWIMATSSLVIVL